MMTPEEFETWRKWTESSGHRWITDPTHNGKRDRDLLLHTGSESGKYLKFSQDGTLELGSYPTFCHPATSVSLRPSNIGWERYMTAGDEPPDRPKASEGRTYKGLEKTRGARPMKIVEIALRPEPDEHHVITDVAEGEASFGKACREIENGNWDRAFQIFDLLIRSRRYLPLGLVEAAAVAKDIVDPRNSPREAARKLLDLMPGRIVRFTRL